MDAQQKYNSVMCLLSRKNLQDGDVLAILGEKDNCYASVHKNKENGKFEFYFFPGDDWQYSIDSLYEHLIIEHRKPMLLQDYLTRKETKVDKQFRDSDGNFFINGDAYDYDYRNGAEYFVIDALRLIFIKLGIKACDIKRKDIEFAIGIINSGLIAAWETGCREGRR